jgi:hypothetical protein
LGKSLEKTEIISEEKKDEKTAGEDKKAEDGVEMEGGMSTTDPRNAHVDDQEYKGFAEFSACLLRNAIVNEFFGDCLKARLIDFQFNKENVAKAG